MYAFADAFDYSYTMKHDLENILRKTIPLKMLTDSKSIFDVITKPSTTTKKRLLINIKAIREGYENLENSNVGFVRSNNNQADAFTNLGSNNALHRILQHCCADFDVEHCVIRTKEKNREC